MCKMIVQLSMISMMQYTNEITFIKLQVLRDLMQIWSKIILDKRKEHLFR